MSVNHSSKRERSHFSGQEKTAIVKAHLVDGKSVADLCDQYEIQPTQFYQWQKLLFEQGSIVFDRQAKPGAKSPEKRKIEQLEAKLTSKNEVIAELMEENVKAKKANGEL